MNGHGSNTLVHKQLESKLSHIRFLLARLPRTMSMNENVEKLGKLSAMIELDICLRMTCEAIEKALPWIDDVYPSAACNLKAVELPLSGDKNDVEAFIAVVEIALNGCKDVSISRTVDPQIDSIRIDFKN